MLYESTRPSKISKDDIDQLLDAFIEILNREVLVNGNDIRLPKCVVFKQKILAGRTGRNPRTGEPLKISGSKSIAFKTFPSVKIVEE